MANTVRFSFNVNTNLLDETQILIKKDNTRNTYETRYKFYP